MIHALLATAPIQSPSPRESKLKPVDNDAQKLTVSSDLRLQGAGASSTILDGGYNNGEPQSFALVVVAAARAEIADITIRNNGGSGIVNEGTLTLTRCAIRDNYNYGSAGGIANRGTLTLVDTTVAGNRAVSAGRWSSGGGIDNFGSLTLINSVVSGNSASGGPVRGGGIYSSSASARLTLINSVIRDNGAYGTTADGGGIFVAGGTTLVNTMVISNTAYSSGPIGVSRGGGIWNEGSLQISQSAIVSNTVMVGTLLQGGGIGNSGTLTITNSTISGNQVRDGQDFGEYKSRLSGGGLSNSGVLFLATTTIVSNTIQNGGVMFGGGISNTATLTLKNTLLAGNRIGSGSGPDCAGTLISGGHNLIQNPDGCTLAGDSSGNRIGVDARVAPLGNSGAATLTHALLPGSPAIEAGANQGCPSVDQRGRPRPYDSDGDGTATCEIGAYEVVPPFPPRSYLPLAMGAE